MFFAIIKIVKEHNKRKVDKMITIILAILSFIYIMLFPIGNVYADIGVWVACIFGGMLIDTLILVIYDRIERKKKREEILKKVLTNRQ